MSPDTPSDPDLTDETDQQLRRLLSQLPALAMPAATRSRIVAALEAEAATRTALLANDADPTPTPAALDKRLLPQPHEAPSATDVND